MDSENKPEQSALTSSQKKRRDSCEDDETDDWRQPLQDNYFKDRKVYDSLTLKAKLARKEQRRQQRRQS
jgi:hypothetical protein